ncbi:unnamed protein product [Sympodiomycopsis kandeliae]
MHPLDSPTPALVDYATNHDTRFRPLDNESGWLSRAGVQVGISVPEGTGLLRRSWSVKEQMYGSLKPTALMLKMGHHSMTKRLHRETYVAEADPARVVDRAVRTHPFAETSAAATLVHTVPERAKIKEVSLQDIDAIHRALSDVIDLLADSDITIVIVAKPTFKSWFRRQA